MDERHLWIAAHIKGSFDSGEFQNQTAIEEFMLQEEILDKVNYFLSGNGSPQLFFYHESVGSSQSSLRDLKCALALDSEGFKKNGAEKSEISLLYFFRPSVIADVPLTQFEKEVIVGHMRGKVLDSFVNVFKRVILPLLKCRRDWGHCSEENKNVLLNTVDKSIDFAKSVSAISEDIAQENILAVPSELLVETANIQTDANLINLLDTTVSTWISTIENLITGFAHESSVSSTEGPLSELDRWRHRQKMLNSLTEQLKSKSCKTVLTLLVASKSKVLKKWRIVDSQITDALNEAKDRLKFMTSLSRQFEEFYAPNATPQSIAETTIPNLMNALVQADSVSRFHARSGFLGLLMAKLTNQLVNVSKAYILDLTTSGEQDKFWSAMEDDLQNLSVEYFTDLLSKSNESRYKARRRINGDTTDINSNALCGRLQASIQLYFSYRTQLLKMRDSINLVTSHGGSNAGSVMGSKVTSKHASATADSRSHRAVGSVALTDDDMIFGHFDEFCRRLHTLLDLSLSLKQLLSFGTCAVDLPRISSEVLNGLETPVQTADASAADQIGTEATSLLSARRLEAITEREEEGIPASSGKGKKSTFEREPSLLEQIENDSESREKSTVTAESEEEDDVRKHSVSHEEILALKHFLGGQSNDPEIVTVADVTKTLFNDVFTSFTANLSSSVLLDVETENKEFFSKSFLEFSMRLSEFENFLCAYLNVVFLRRQPVFKAIRVLKKFDPLEGREAIREVLAEKYVDAFIWFQPELRQIQEIYEENKNNPPSSRDAPPVGGIVEWCRQLLQRIEEPMRIFRAQAAINSLRDFGRVSRLYNALAAPLVAYETMCLQRWRREVNGVTDSFRLTLLYQDPETGQLIVNADPRIREHIAESHYLQRLGIELPKAAVQLLIFELTFKRCYDKLSSSIRQFASSVDRLLPRFRPIFASHHRRVMTVLHPGLSTLAWNSVNIEAYLHSAETVTTSFRNAVDGFLHDLDAQVYSKIKELKACVLIDYSPFEDSFSLPLAEFRSLAASIVSGRSSNAAMRLLEIQENVRKLVSRIYLGDKNPSFTGGSDVSSRRHDRGSNDSDKDLENLIGVVMSELMPSINSAVEIMLRKSLVQLESVISFTPFVTVEDELPSMARKSNEQITSLGDFSTYVESVNWWQLVSACLPGPLAIRIIADYTLPKIRIEPSPNEVFDSCKALAAQICSFEKSFNVLVPVSEILKEFMETQQIKFNSAKIVFDAILRSCQHFDWIWQDSSSVALAEAVSSPSMAAVELNLDAINRLETCISTIPKSVSHASFLIGLEPIIHALDAAVRQWKHKFSSQLHERARAHLDKMWLYMDSVTERLAIPTDRLEDLSAVIALFDETADVQLNSDALFTQIETLYRRIERSDVAVPREETDRVENLRFRWASLVSKLDALRVSLLRDRRSAFEQELDKQTKAFVLEVIQFRNRFDAHGPGVSGIAPAEAVRRLNEFKMHFAEYENKKQVLHTVARLFGIPARPFTELTRLEEELNLLTQLYSVYQEFIDFDETFHQTLWVDLNYEYAMNQVTSFWNKVINLPDRLQKWEACSHLKESINFYREVLPLIEKLAAKHIRSRHWLQVMSLTGQQFPLEANILAMDNLLRLPLLKYKQGIEEICTNAAKEMDLEMNLRKIQEEWTEQQLSFAPYGQRGPLLLAPQFTGRLVEQLEDAQTTLANMLTSRHVAPLRSEVAGWAERLRDVAQILDLWLQVQDRWQELEVVFSRPDTAKELPQIAEKFFATEKTWVKLMIKAHETRNVIQCCITGDSGSRLSLLLQLRQDLEQCTANLQSYIDSKRLSFPRFALLSNSALLAALSRPYSLESLKPVLKSLFANIGDIRLMVNESRTAERQRVHLASGANGEESAFRLRSSGTPSSGQPEKGASSIPADRLRALPSEKLFEEIRVLEAYELVSWDGEELKLVERVVLDGAMESWLARLRISARKSLDVQFMTLIRDMSNGISPDDWVLKYPTQCCIMGLLLAWTVEVDLGIAELKAERRALTASSKKFAMYSGRLVQMAVTGRIVGREMQSVTYIQRTRLDSLISYSLYLRDIVEGMANQKMRDPIEFDWRKCIKCYPTKDGELIRPLITILDAGHQYGGEFYGARPILAIGPDTERCFIGLSESINRLRGAAIVGPAGSGKSETIRGFAQLCGRFMALIGCLRELSASAIGRIVQGMAMSGDWCCMDDVELLVESSALLLSGFCQAIMSALRAGSPTCIVASGEHVTLSPDARLFTAYTSSAVSIGSCSIPASILSTFRPVAINFPSPQYLLRIRACELGFRSWQCLSARLAAVMDLSALHLRESVARTVNLSSMLRVLERAALRRRSARAYDAAVLAAVAKDAVPPRRSVETEQFEFEQPGDDSELQEASSPQDSARADSKTVKRRKVVRRHGNIPPLSNSVKADHALVGHFIKQLIGSRIPADQSPLFNQIVSDVFSGLPMVRKYQVLVDIPGVGERRPLESVIASVAEEHGLETQSGTWLEKCLQIYEIARVSPGIIIAGPAGIGKSSALRSLVEALSSVAVPTSNDQRHVIGEATPEALAGLGHRIQKLYPMVSDNVSTIFGDLRPDGSWRDGVFTTILKKANRNESVTWLTLDGPLSPVWTEYFAGLLDARKTFTFGNGDQLFLGTRVRLIFETDSIINASPATVSRMGVVYFDMDITSWRPTATMWLATQSEMSRRVLEPAFDRTFDLVFQFLQDNRPALTCINELGLLAACLSLLGALIADNQSLTQETHLERLFVFSVISTFGSVLAEVDRKAFGDGLKTVTVVLPDDDREISVFDYYVDETGEWDTWLTKIPDNQVVDSPLAVVDTVDTVRARLILSSCWAAGRNVLVMGKTSSAKTMLINEFLTRTDVKKTVVKSAVGSISTSADGLQALIESNVVHRQGYVYGAKDRKRLAIFVDDVNLPEKQPLELMRQVADDGFLVTTKAPYEWHQIENILLIGAATILTSASSAVRTSSLGALNHRLSRHFTLVQVNPPEGEELKSVLSAVLNQTMHSGQGQLLDVELHSGLVSVACQVLGEVLNVLRPAPCPGRTHYLFSVRDLVTCFQALRRLDDDSRSEAAAVVPYWRHEMMRTISDRLCRASDIYWFRSVIDNAINDRWPELNGNINKIFVTIPDFASSKGQAKNAGQPREGKPEVAVIESVATIRDNIAEYLTHYMEDVSNRDFDVALTDAVLEQVVRMHRLLAKSDSCKLLLLAQHGFKIIELCRLSLHIADTTLCEVDTSTPDSFITDMRNLIRQAGLEPGNRAIIVKSAELRDPRMWDLLNSVLVSSFHHLLLSNDELEALLQTMVPQIRSRRNAIAGSIINNSPFQLFLRYVSEGLRIIIVVTPDDPLLKNAMTTYPGLLKSCSVNWISDWEPIALIDHVTYYLRDGIFNEIASQPYTISVDGKDLRKRIAECMANIHMYMIEFFAQLRWVGDVSQEVQIPTDSYNATAASSTAMMNKRRTETATPNTANGTMVPNFPYSKFLFSDCFKSFYRGKLKGKPGQVFICSKTFQNFIDLFIVLYRRKSQEIGALLELYSNGVAVLEKSAVDCTDIKESIKDKRREYSEVTERANQMLQLLIAKVTQLEKLKTERGLNPQLRSILDQVEADVSFSPQDDPLLRDDLDDFDREFDKIQEEKNNQRLAELALMRQQAEAEMESYRNNLHHAREQVMLWRSRVEKTTIERLRSFQKPSKTIIEVMEMVMTLIGKRSPAAVLAGRGEAVTMTQDGASTGTAPSVQNTRQQLASRVTAQPQSDSARWKLMQVLMSDSGRFVETVLGVPWEDGLKTHLRMALETYFAKNESGELGLTGEGSLLENAADTNIAAKRSITNKNQVAVAGITISSARFASEDAAILVQYIIAVVEYSRRCAPLQAAMDKLKEIDKEVEDISRMAEQRRRESSTSDTLIDELLDEIEPSTVAKAAQLAEAMESDAAEVFSDRRESRQADDMEALEAEVATLQKQYDDLIEQKHSLNHKVEDLRQQLADISTVVRRLEPVRTTWATYITANNDPMGLLVNCLMAAAFLVYGAPADIDTRNRIMQYLGNITEHHHLTIRIPRVLKDIPLLLFLSPQVGVDHLRILRFPSTPELLDNLCLLAEADQLSTTWPLICDPTRFVERWLQTYLEACRPSQIVVVRHEELKGQLEYSLAEGHVLVILDCDLKRLFNDRRMVDVIKSKWLFFRKQKSNTLKFTVNKQEVEAKMGFRLILHTTHQPHVVPFEMFAQLAVAYFPFNRASIEEELLGHFMRKEKARTEADFLSILVQEKRNFDTRKAVETSVAKNLRDCASLSLSPSITKQCLELCNRYEETVEVEKNLKANAAELEAVRQTFVRVAQLASVCCDLMQRLTILSPLYHISFTQFLTVFHQSIEHSERTTPKTIQDRLVYNCYAYVSRMVTDLDRNIFVLALALEMEEMAGRVKPNERRYLISPIFAAQFSEQHLRDTSNQKSPFDWMSDEQWTSLNILAQLVPPIADVPRLISTDGTENQWRHITESDVPELCPLPQTNGINTSLTPLQNLLVFRSIRSDRTLPAAVHFVRNVLGKKFITEAPVDVNDILAQSADDCLILMMYKCEPDNVYDMFTSWTQQLEVSSVVLPTTNLQASSSSFEQFLESNVQATVAQGGWLLVREIGRNPSIFGLLLGCIRKIENKPTNFRCVLSIDASNEDLVPTEVLHHSLRVLVDTPKLMRSSLVHSISTLHPDQLRQSPRNEWPILVHNLCFLHAAIRLRARYGSYGWSRPEQLRMVSHADLLDCLTLVVNCLMDNHEKHATAIASVMQPRTFSNLSSSAVPAAIITAERHSAVAQQSDGEAAPPSAAPPVPGIPRGTQLPWVNIRHAVSEIYGKYLTEETDRATLAALVDIWLSLNSIKREFEITKLKYKPPAILFQGGLLKPSAIASAFDNFAEFQLEVPDAAGFHPVKENYLGDDQYVLTRLNKLYDVISGDAIAAAVKIEGQESSALYTETSLVPVSINSILPNVLQRGVNASATLLLTRCIPLDVEMADICSSVLSKLPRTYSRGYLVEKLKKIGGLTSFNTLLLSEMEILYGVVNGIRHDLTQLRSTLTMTTFGWQLDDDMIKIAAALYHGQIPHPWLRLSGDAAPEDTFPLATWVADLAHRVSVLERLFLLGREKTPAYWLGAFSRPQALLALMKQDAFRYYGVLRAGAVDSLVFHTELTARDKDHLRDPPQEGMFIFGLHLWGCGWDKAVNELLDTTSRRYPAELPVIHVTCIPISEKPTVELAKSLEQFNCPVYATRSRSSTPLFEVQLHRDGIQASRWHLRGVFSTIRPY